MRKQKCKHTTVTYTWLDTRTSTPVSKHCSPKFGCGATLSLGPANDEPSAVQMEMRAVVLEHDSSYAWSGKCPGTATTFEQWGWLSHTDTTSVGVLSGDEVAGYLARELATHDSRETRDANAWPWDPSRAVAGQWELSQHVEILSDALDSMDEGTRPGGPPDPAAVTECLAGMRATPLFGATNADGDPVDLDPTSFPSTPVNARGRTYRAINGAFDAMDAAHAKDEEEAALEARAAYDLRTGTTRHTVPVDGEAWKLHAPVASRIPPHDGFPGPEEQARERERLSPGSVNADGDPVEWASARNKAAAAVEDALRPKPSWTCVQRTVDVHGADVGIAADEWPTPIVETDGAE